MTKGKAISEQSVYANTILAFGPRAQVDMLHEEVGELLSAINKYNRGRASKEDVITEIADVMIMCGQMAFLFGPDEVRAEKERKLIRLQQRIDEHNSKHEKRNNP